VKRRVRMPPPKTDQGAPEFDEDTVRALTGLQRAIFKYPLATQAAFAALVAEGRRYATTPEGAELKRRLEYSEAAGRARMLWEVLSLNTFSEKHDGALPSLLLESLLRAIKTKHIEPLLSKIFERQM
jgi:hypothetical protein